MQDAAQHCNIEVHQFEVNRLDSMQPPHTLTPLAQTYTCTGSRCLLDDSDHPMN